uniref:Uncharacterized protein LOC114344771 n=1 Tax=Diabrotica virgifera virgifera TaxID=50390 RepID=A0A6P7H105_DIAVI
MSRSRSRSKRSYSSSSSESSRERYRKRNTMRETVEKSYTPKRKSKSQHPRQTRVRSTVRSSSSRRETERHLRDMPDATRRIAKLEALVEKLSRKSDVVQRNTTRDTVRSDCIPEFSPDNPNLSASKWLDKVDQLREINGWDDVSTIFHMQSRLVGMAKSWYHNLAEYNHTWNGWKRLILKSFPDHNDYAALLRKMLDRKKHKGETMTVYYFEKMELLRSCRITGKEAVSCLIDGLDENVVRNGARAG